MLAGKLGVLLVAHLSLIASLHLDHLEGVELVTRFLHLGVDERDLVFNLLALCLVSLIRQTSLVHLIAVIDDLRIELDYNGGHVLERLFKLLAKELIVAYHVAVIAKERHLQILDELCVAATRCA